jgi:aspartyl-tRNA(Asn)/glutamyl-tRNA(Gln) amidotransferase subunit A
LKEGSKRIGKDSGVDELCMAPLIEIAKVLRKREVSSRELVDAYLKRIDSLEQLGAYITVTAEAARKQAALADDRLRLGAGGALLGVPIAVKDIFDTKGVRTTAGSRILQENVPKKDAVAVARLLEAGVVLLGKLNMHEFAYGVTNLNPHYGPARNPHDRGRIPGGSSGGSAVAVVAGLCAASLGTDTGGSIRIPASLCGCVGLKPTYAAIPTEGVIPLGRSLDHVGPITRTVDDARMLFEVLTDNVVSDPTQQPRIGVLQGEPFDLVDPAVLKGFQGGLDALREAGSEIKELRLAETAMTQAAQLVTLRAEASEFHGDWLRKRPEDYGPDVRTRLRLGLLTSAADYVVAQRARYYLREAMRRAFDEVDLLALPTTPVVAPPIGEQTVTWPAQKEPVDVALVRLTSAFNLTGLPAISVPCGLERGLPIGFQLVARWNDEGSLFNAARVVEACASR